MTNFKRIINTALVLALLGFLIAGARFDFKRKLYSRENMLIDIPDNMKSLYIGDSRTMGLFIASGGGKDENTGWIAEGGVKLEWFREYAEAIAADKIGDCKRIVVLLGINDILGNQFNDGENADSGEYIECLEKFAQKYEKRGVTVYYVSVLPVDSSYADLNELVEKFNKRVGSGLQNCHYIDLYKEVINKDYSTVDGLHFDMATSADIYNDLAKFLRDDY